MMVPPEEVDEVVVTKEVAETALAKWVVVAILAAVADVAAHQLGLPAAVVVEEETVAVALAVEEREVEEREVGREGDTEVGVVLEVIGPVVVAVVVAVVEVMVMVMVMEAHMVGLAVVARAEAAALVMGLETAVLTTLLVAMAWKMVGWVEAETKVAVHLALMGE